MSERYMEYHFAFESDAFTMQDPSRFDEINLIGKSIETVLGIPIKVEMHKSGINKEKRHFFVRAYSNELFEGLNALLTAIDGKMDALKRMGIEEVVLWGLYGYVAQCNMEFIPEHLSIMGRNNIHFCISCWEENDDEPIENKIEDDERHN